MQVFAASLVVKLNQIIEFEEGKEHPLGEIEGLNIMAFPIAHKVPCFGYVVKELDKPGQLDSKKAASLGICIYYPHFNFFSGAKGKELGQLKAGQAVTLASGIVIKV